MKKLLFLDDVRMPQDCASYMFGHRELYSQPVSNWTIVRNYNEFVKYIEKNGVPDLISFDHDLSDEHYSPEMYGENYNDLYKDFKEKTGYECAKWLVSYCSVNGVPPPDYIVHSMNPVGRDNIIKYLDSYKKFESKVS